jgi:hypothetical protein
MDISYWSRIKDDSDSCFETLPFAIKHVDMIVDVGFMNLMEKGWIPFACDCLGGVF